MYCSGQWEAPNSFQIFQFFVSMGNKLSPADDPCSAKYAIWKCTLCLEILAGCLCCPTQNLDLVK